MEVLCQNKWEPWLPTQHIPSQRYLSTFDPAWWAPAASQEPRNASGFRHRRGCPLRIGQQGPHPLLRPHLSEPAPALASGHPGRMPLTQLQRGQQRFQDQQGLSSCHPWGTCMGAVAPVPVQLQRCQHDPRGVTMLSCPFLPLADSSPLEDVLETTSVHPRAPATHTMLRVGRGTVP